MQPRLFAKSNTTVCFQSSQSATGKKKTKRSLLSRDTPLRNRYYQIRWFWLIVISYRKFVSDLVSKIYMFCIGFNKFLWQRSRSSFVRRGWEREGRCQESETFPGGCEFVGKFRFALILPKFSHAANNKFAIMRGLIFLCNFWVSLKY